MGKLIGLIGAGGSGKTTIVNEMIIKYPSLKTCNVPTSAVMKNHGINGHEHVLNLLRVEPLKVFVFQEDLIHRRLVEHSYYKEHPDNDDYITDRTVFDSLFYLSSYMQCMPFPEDCYARFDQLLKRAIRSNMYSKMIFVTPHGGDVGKHETGNGGRVENTAFQKFMSFNMESFLISNTVGFSKLTSTKIEDRVKSIEDAFGYGIKEDSTLKGETHAS